LCHEPTSTDLLDRLVGAGKVTATVVASFLMRRV
jgi:hypothetical protein